MGREGLLTFISSLSEITFLFLHNRLPYTYQLETTHNFLSPGFHGSGIWAQLCFVLFSGSHKTAIQVSTGLQSHPEAWPGKNASLLIQVVGRIYFLEAARLRAQLLLGADCLSKSVDSQSTDLVHSSLPCGLLSVDTYFSKPARRLSHYIIRGMTLFCGSGASRRSCLHSKGGDDTKA